MLDGSELCGTIKLMNILSVTGRNFDVGKVFRAGLIKGLR